MQQWFALVPVSVDLVADDTHQLGGMGVLQLSFWVLYTSCIPKLMSLLPYKLAPLMPRLPPLPVSSPSGEDRKQTIAVARNTL